MCVKAHPFDTVHYEFPYIRIFDEFRLTRIHDELRLTSSQIPCSWKGLQENTALYVAGAAGD